MKYKLKDVFELQMGKTPSRNKIEYWDSKDYKWISIADLSKTGKYISETKECLSEYAIEESGIKIIPRNTVVMSFKLSIGKVAITADDMYSNEAIMAFIDKKVVEIIPEYIYYLFKYRTWDEGSNKAVMGKTLNKATLSEVEIEICSIEQQKEIVRILDKMSSIIDNRKNELLLMEKATQARFVEMFGDSEHNTKSWSVAKLSSLCNVGSSKRIYQSELTETGIPFLRISDLNEKIDGKNNTPQLFIPNDKYDELQTNGLVPSVGDILVTARGTLGRCYIIKPNDTFYFQDGMISWLSDINESITSLYLSYLFSTTGVQNQIANLQAGSTVAYLSIAMLKKLDIMIPPMELQNQFADFVAQVDKSKAAIKKALDEAQLLFDSLMQKYFG